MDTVKAAKLRKVAERLSNNSTFILFLGSNGVSAGMELNGLNHRQL
jgi:hypothetical protein